MGKCNKILRIIPNRFVLIAITLSSCTQNSINSLKPNIIIIYADDLGYGDLSTYGGDIPSPNIQRLSDSGIKFTDFYVSGPVCTPSRYGLLTSRYPQRSIHNLTGALMPEEKGHLDRTEKILPEYLKDFGYRTAIFGKWHLGNNKPEYFPCNFGFDKFVGHTHGCIDYFTHVYGSLGHDWYEDCLSLNEEGYSTDLITKHAIEFLSKQDKDPFFVYLAYNAPHYGKSDPENLPQNTIILQQGVRHGVNFANTLQAPKEYIERFDHVPDIYRRYYSAMVSNLDDNIGKLLDFLEQSAKMENIIIWFISDNGGYSVTNFKHSSNGSLRGQKAELYEGGVRIPSILSWKGVVKPGQVISQPAINLDVLPTILEIIQPEYTKNISSLDGISLLPVILKNKKIERDIFWQFGNQKALRRGNWKLVNNELYNLSNDISESVDLLESNLSVYEDLNNSWESMANEMK